MVRKLIQLIKKIVTMKVPTLTSKLPKEVSKQWPQIVVVLTGMHVQILLIFINSLNLGTGYA